MDFLGKHGAELVVKGICLIAIICDYLAICCNVGDTNAFSFVCFDKSPELFWVLFLDFLQCDCLGSLCMIWLQLYWLVF